MERPTELVLRNQHRMDADEILIIEPARDDCARELSLAGKKVHLQTLDFATYRWHLACGSDVSFGELDSKPEPTVPEPAALAQYGLTIVYLSREKKRLEMVLHRAASQVPDGGRLWLVGENRAGIKSTRSLLERFFAQVTKLDAARHCVIFAAARPRIPCPFQLEEYFSNWTLEQPGPPLRLASLPGVFAHGRLDAGSALLLEHLPKLSAGQELLDFGCGTGLLGLSALANNPGISVTLLDSSALALESARRSATLNRLRAQILPSDGFSEVRRSFDWIVSNPPFHRGVDTDFETTRRFCSEAGRHLRPNGNIMLVANRHLPYGEWLDAVFHKVSVVAETNAFKVISAGRKKTRH